MGCGESPQWPQQLLLLCRLLSSLLPCLGFLVDKTFLERRQERGNLKFIHSSSTRAYYKWGGSGEGAWHFIHSFNTL